MSEFKKGNSFKGKSKNRNKKLSEEDRRVMYTKKKSKREFDEKVIAREELQDYLGKEVNVKGKLVFINKKNPLSSVLVDEVVIDGIDIDHLWVEFNIEDRRELKELPRGSTIEFTGVVHKYVKRNDRQIGLKYGVKFPKLIKD